MKKTDTKQPSLDLTVTEVEWRPRPGGGGCQSSTTSPLCTCPITKP